MGRKRNVNKNGNNYYSHDSKTYIGSAGVANRSITKRRCGGSGYKINMMPLNQNPSYSIPLITLLGNSVITVEKGEQYNDAGVTAQDYLGVSLTSSVAVTSNLNIAEVGSYEIYYNVADSRNNSADEVVRIVNVVDTYSPTITIIGNTLIEVGKNDLYTDQGATAEDHNGGDLTSSIVVSSNVDTSVEGTYTVTYNVSDASNNAATEVVRSVIVKDIYDFLIVGGGPSGSMAAYTLAESEPTKRILLLEKGSSTIEEYKSKGYDNIFNWFNAQNDPDFKNSYMSTDNKNIWTGKSVGGGTNVFGLQYIDQDDIVNASYPEWRSDPLLDGEDVLSSVNSIMQAQRYSYDDTSSKVNENSSYMELKQKIESNVDGLKMYNNKIYSTDVNSNSRLLIGDKINNVNNVEIQYGKTVSVISNPSNDTVQINAFDGSVYTARKCILCAGSIQSSAALQRSNISCGDTLMDHAGLTVLYGKLQPQSTQTTTPYSGDYTISLNSETLGKMYTHSARYVYSVSGPNLPLEDVGKVYDFTYWLGLHPGGAVNISKWINSDNHLEFPSSHPQSRWHDYKSNFVELGRIDDVINYNDLTEEIKSAALYNDLFPDTVEDGVTYEPVQDLGFSGDTIISHLQSRDESFRHQAYFSAVPGLNNYVIVTLAQSSVLPGVGKVRITNNDEVEPSVTLSHFGEGEVDANNNQYIDDIYNAYVENNKMMTELNYVQFQPNPQEVTVTKEYIKENAATIYHYHGSNKDAVDEHNKVLELENVYIGDISTCNKAYPGSTSVAALVKGYTTAKYVLKSLNSNSN